MKNGESSVHFVNSAIQALDYLHQLEKEKDFPKLIIIDLYLPLKNAAEFIAELKQVERYNKIPIIILSTLSFEVDGERYRKMGVLDYLSKPTSYHEYYNIAQYLKQKISA